MRQLQETPDFAPVTRLIGRSDDCERIDPVLQDARLGSSAALVLPGAAGADASEP